MKPTVNGTPKTADYLGHRAGRRARRRVHRAVRLGRPPQFVPLTWRPAAALAWDAFLSLVFFAQHSGMVRRPFRARLARVLPAATTAPVTAISSGLTLTLVLVLCSASTFRVPPRGAARWSRRGSRGARRPPSSCSSGYAVRRTIDFIGLRRILAHLRGAVPRVEPFFVDGPYRWVRHPPVRVHPRAAVDPAEMMADGLLLSILWSGWISWVRCSKSATWLRTSETTTGATSDRCPCSSPGAAVSRPATTASCRRHHVTLRQRHVRGCRLLAARSPTGVVEAGSAGRPIMSASREPPT